MNRIFTITNGIFMLPMTHAPKWRNLSAISSLFSHSFIFSPFLSHSHPSFPIISLAECKEEYPCQGLGEHANFRNFGIAYLTLFRVATGDNWNGIMKDTLRENCDSSGRNAAREL